MPTRKPPATFDGRHLYAEAESLLTDSRQSTLEAETGLTRSSLGRLKNGIPVRLSTYAAFEAYVAKHRPSPWPESPVMGDIRKNYELSQKKAGKEGFAAFLACVEALLLQSVHLQGPATYDSLYALWLLAWVAHDKNMLDQAVARYDQTLARLHDIREQQGESPRILLLTGRLKVSQFAAFFNGKDEYTRSRDPLVREWIRDSQVMASIQHLAQGSPKDWSMQRNGLVVASVLQDEDACLRFHAGLIGADALFATPGYSPSAGVRCLEKDPDLWFFREVLKSSEKLAIPHRARRINQKPTQPPKEL